MPEDKEKVAILYCERSINPDNFCREYEAESWANAHCILDKYKAMAERLMDPPRLDISFSVVKTEGPLITISGSAREIEKAMKKILGVFELPPETKIVPPGKYAEYLGSSDGGYNIARRMAAAMGHRLRKSGEVLHRKLEVPA